MNKTLYLTVDGKGIHPTYTSSALSTQFTPTLFWGHSRSLDRHFLYRILWFFSQTLKHSLRMPAPIPATVSPLTYSLLVHMSLKNFIGTIRNHIATAIKNTFLFCSITKNNQSTLERQKSLGRPSPSNASNMCPPCSRSIFVPCPPWSWI